MFWWYLAVIGEVSQWPEMTEGPAAMRRFDGELPSGKETKEWGDGATAFMRLGTVALKGESLCTSCFKERWRLHHFWSTAIRFGLLIVLDGILIVIKGPSQGLLGF